MLTTTQCHSLCVFAMLLLWPFDEAVLRAQFTDVTDQYGLVIYHDIPISESGVSFHDFNRDGLDDLTYAGSGMGVFTFRNTGSGFVQEYYFAGIAGKTLHPIWVDYDNDGDADFFATRAWQCPVLFRNNGDMTFEDVSEALPCPMDGVISTTATWGDYNSDGFLDVYVANYNQQPTIGDHNWLFRNNGDGTFDEVAEEVGVSYGNFPAYQCMFLDADFDHDTDLLVVNDKGDGCQFFRNDNGMFTDIANDNGFNVHINAMSLSVSDVDHDGDYDYYVSNTVSGNVFLINENGTFVNRAAEWNATVNANCWGSVFVDTQQKTWEDLYVVSTGPQEGLNVLLQNSQGSTMNAGYSSFNGEDAEFVFAVAKGDANNDGAYDVMCMPYYADGSLLFQAAGPGSTWVKVALQGTTSNRDGIGATIHCFVNGVDYIRPVTCGENFTSQDSRYIMFGLNGATVVDSVVVQWPSGNSSVHVALPAGQTHVLIEPDEQEEWVQQIEYEVLLCSGASAMLDASEWYTVEWEGGSSEWQLEVFSEGVYTANAWNEQGDQFALQYAVMQLPTPDPQWQIQPSLCGGNDAALLAGESVNLLWVNGAPYMQGSEELSSGTIVVEWADTLGCSFTAQLELPYVEPMLLFAASDTACFGEVAHFTIEALHAWEPLIWLGVNSSAGELPAGSYPVICIDARGCSASTELLITERAPSEFLILADTACFGSTAEVVYAWIGAVDPVVQLGEPLEWSAMQPGEYEVEWVDAASCEMETAFEVYAYNPIEWEAEIMNASEDGGGQLMLNIEGGLPPYSVLWSNGSQGVSLEDLEQGVYSAEIADAAGCSVATGELLVPLSLKDEFGALGLVYDLCAGLCNRSTNSCEILIIDASGRMLTRKQLAPGASWSCNHFADGYYLAICDLQVLPFAIQH
jgi:hypothetical protein